MARDTSEVAHLSFNDGERRCSGALLMVVDGVYLSKVDVNITRNAAASGSVRKEVMIKQVVWTKHSSPGIFHGRLHGIPLHCTLRESTNIIMARMRACEIAPTK
jgi:hypothetical protein